MPAKIFNMVPLLKAKRSGSAVHAGEFKDGYAAFAKKNYAVAMAYFKHAAAQGDADAQYSLGHMYDKGLGVVQDYAEAVKLYRLAAAQGLADAQSNLGFMYYSGQGVVQDYVRAHMWWNLAAAHGNAGSVKNRDIVAARMTTQQIAAAQKLARECQARDYKNCD